MYDYSNIARSESFVKGWKVLLYVLALLGVLLLHGAVPFIALPTLGQAVIMMGSSQAFANDSVLTVYSRWFGYPQPAALLMGMPVAYPAGLMIKMGLHPADAYAAMAAIWLTVAFFGAKRLSIWLGLRGLGALIAAVLWMSMPVTWGHAGYSSLSLGIALLPFYLWAALRVIAEKIAKWQDQLSRAAAFIAVCIIAVFMDGYSYVMFAVGACLLGAFCFFRLPELRRNLLVISLPVIICGFTLSFLLYTAYIGQSSFEGDSLDFFRGWGLDLAFTIIPTQGIHWFWDVTGLSVARSDRYFFGDLSVWTTTFSFPVIVAGLFFWWRARKRVLLATGLLLVALFGLYMSLGPSLKVNSVRPEAMIETGDFSPLMPAELAVAPTGSAVLSEHLPGFQSMRAAYRWLALAMVGFWGLIVVGLGTLNSRKNSAWGLLLLVTLIVFNMPRLDWKWQRFISQSHLGNAWQEMPTSYFDNRDMFLRLENELVSEMRGLLHEGERVAFLPYRNDFLVNYLAARLRIHAFNIGGDKNLFDAKEHWPPTMRSFSMWKVDRAFAERVLLLLARQESDVVVLPYIDMLWAGHSWPAPAEFREELAPVIAELKKSGFVTIEERDYYAVVRIAAEYRDELTEGNFDLSIMERHGSVYPIIIAEPTVALLWTLGSGWHDLEPTHVWSGKEAELRLPIPKGNRGGGYAAEIAFFVNGASAERAVEIMFETEVNGAPVAGQLVFRSGALQRVLVPLSAGSADQFLRIRIPNATSPKDLQESLDVRVLGVALRSIELVRGGPDARIGTVIRASGFTEETPTHVGVLHEAALVTTGRAGYLVFGPYAAMGAGEYRLVLKGTASHVESAWVDVVSGSGSVQHARLRLSTPPGGEEGILASGRVSLVESVDDLEVRVSVGETDLVRLEGYELLPVEGESSASEME